MASKRNPSALVTDARDRPPNRGGSDHRRSGAVSSAASSSQDPSGSDYGRGPQAPASQRQRLPMGHISVDHILQNASEIPSGQPRGPPGLLRMLPSSTLSTAVSASTARRRGLTRRSSSSFGINTGGGVGGGGLIGPAGGVGVSSGAMVPGSMGVLGVGGAVAGSGMLLSTRAVLPNVPSRTTKISEKLVLLPETGDDKSKSDEDDEDEAALTDGLDLRSDASAAAAMVGDGSDEPHSEAARRAMQRARMALEEAAADAAAADDYAAGSSLFDGVRPPRDEELDVLRKRGGIRGKSYAERLPKGQRTEKVARLTAYCTAQAFKMRATADFLRTHHAAKTKLYDDCLYTVYHLPLLPGHDGFRVRSRPMLKTPGTGKTVLDLEIERSERRDEHMGYYDDGRQAMGNGDGRQRDGQDRQGGLDSQRRDEQQQQHQHQHQQDHQQERQPLYGVSGGRLADMMPVNRLAPDAKHFAELFVFSYGVVVFWNFTEHQEKDILADLAFAEDETAASSAATKGGAAVVAAAATSGLLTRPLDEADFETEEFHFEYSASVQRPRVFNDMITLLPRSDHMVKLTISHAIAQSTKLCFFEEKMSQTMLNAQNVPKRLALTGELNMSRTEIVKILGRLFKNRVDINLSSNILDVPNFFWDTEPTLHPLYVAIREYLEIDQRIQVLNERCRVFLDLAEILADSVADAKMSYITWIIILLIVVSILVTVTEVIMRFSILSKEKNKYGNSSSSALAAGRSPYLHVPASPPVVQIHTADAQQPVLPLPGDDLTLNELRAWAARLDAHERAAVCGNDAIGQTFGV